MTVAAQTLMTVEEFLVWAEKRPEKHWELFDGVPEMQQAQSWGHSRTRADIGFAFMQAIARKNIPCFVAIDGPVVKVDARTAFEPDVVVFAGTMAGRDMIVPEPLIVVEVLSPSTARKDLTVKLSGYFKVPSIAHYVIANWEKRELIHYRREGAGIAPPITLNEGALRFDPPGIELAIADIFK